MATVTATTAGTPAAAPPTTHAIHEKLSKGPSKIGALIFGLVLIGGLIFIGSSIAKDLADIRLGST